MNGISLHTPAQCVVQRTACFGLTHFDVVDVILNEVKDLRQYESPSLFLVRGLCEIVISTRSGEIVAPRSLTRSRRPISANTILDLDNSSDELYRSDETMKRIVPAIFGWLYLTSGAHAQPLVFGYSAITSVFLAQEAAKIPRRKLSPLNNFMTTAWCRN